jgi:hypothetical protein
VVDDSNKTLGEIKDGYEDNVNYLEKKIKDHPCENLIQAQTFMGACVNEALTSLGVLVSKDMQPELCYSGAANL